MTDDPNLTESHGVERHYLRIRDGAEVPPALKAYCSHATFRSYGAAAKVRDTKAVEYELKDPSVMEIAFRR